MVALSLARGLVEHFDDRVNPIVVKEVRQALRGRQFMVTFWFMVVAATMVSIAIILSGVNRGASSGEFGNLGANFYSANYFCLLAAIVVVVPAWAFSSMGSEWEENTFDLLVLSDLKPHRIVLGKLLSAGVQTLLFVSATLPCIAFTFLLQGVDLYVIGFSLVYALTLSFALTSVALFLSSISQKRFIRILFSATLTIGCLFALMLSMPFFSMLIRDSSRLLDPDFLPAMTGLHLGLVVVGVLGLAVAAARLAHPEENRSTPLRVISTLSILLAQGWLLWMQLRSPDDDAVVTFSIALIFLSATWCTFFATERQSLGRRVEHQVPKSHALALLLAPLLPGGGRGALLLFCQLALIVVGAFAILATNRSPFVSDGGRAALFVAAGYVILYVALPAGAFWRSAETPRGRIVLRALVPFLFILAMFLPALLGFFLGARRVMELEHPGNPFWLLDEIWSTSPTGGAIAVATGVALLSVWAILLNLPRIMRGLQEVASASRARRQRSESEAVSDAVPES